MPGGSAVGGNFELGNSLVGVDDLHAEPVGRDTFFEVELERGGDGAVYVVPGYVDDAFGEGGEGGEGGGVEIQVVGSAAGTLVSNLRVVSFGVVILEHRIRTIAVMELPEGPVTETQRPQFEAVDQLESESAVPKRLDGRV